MKSLLVCLLLVALATGMYDKHVILYECLPEFLGLEVGIGTVSRALPKTEEESPKTSVMNSVKEIGNVRERNMRELVYSNIKLDSNLLYIAYFSSKLESAHYKM